MGKILHGGSDSVLTLSMKKAGNGIAGTSAFPNRIWEREKRLTLAADIQHKVRPSCDAEAMKQDQGEHQDEKGAKGLGPQGELEVNQICGKAKRDQNGSEDRLDHAADRSGVGYPSHGRNQIAVIVTEAAGKCDREHDGAIEQPGDFKNLRIHMASAGIAVKKDINLTPDGTDYVEDTPASQTYCAPWGGRPFRWFIRSVGDEAQGEQEGAAWPRMPGKCPLFGPAHPGPVRSHEADEQQEDEYIPDHAIFI